MKYGTVELRSGQWEWQEQKRDPPPEWETAKRGLYFEDPDDPRNRMRVAIALDWRLDPNEIPTIAATPDWRQVVDGDELIWHVEPSPRRDVNVGVDRGDIGHLPRRITYRAEGETGGLAKLPEGLQLGELTHSELLRLVR